MVIVSHLDDYGVWVAAVVAGLGAVGWLLRRCRRGIRRVRTFLARLAKGIDQLENNGGSTMRDKLDRLTDGLDSMTMVVDGISDSVDSLTERFDEHVTAQAETLQTQAEAQKALWPAVQAVAEAQPHI